MIPLFDAIFSACTWSTKNGAKGSNKCYQTDRGNIYFNENVRNILIIMWLFSVHRPDAGHIYHEFLACYVSGYIRLGVLWRYL